MIDRMTPEDRERWAERAAIIEHDAGMERDVAEGLAMCLCCTRYLYGCPVAPARKAHCVEFRPEGW